MVLVFELFVLRGAVSPTDRVVGWGVFPVCDAQFRIIEGKSVAYCFMYPVFLVFFFLVFFFYKYLVLHYR